MNHVTFTHRESPALGMSLYEAIGHALGVDSPARLFHRSGDTLAEIFVHRGFVLHSHVNGIEGVPAIAAMLDARLRFDVEYECWPERCTLLATWDAAWQEAESQRVRRVDPRDDEVTDQLVS